MSCSRAFAWRRSVCSLGIGTASARSSSSTVGKMGAAWANSGNTTRRTGRNGALPATAASIISSMRSVLPRICDRFARVGQISLAGSGSISDWRHCQLPVSSSPLPALVFSLLPCAFQPRAASRESRANAAALMTLSTATIASRHACCSDPGSRDTAACPGSAHQARRDTSSSLGMAADRRCPGWRSSDSSPCYSRAHTEETNASTRMPRRAAQWRRTTARFRRPVERSTNLSSTLRRSARTSPSRV